MNELTKQKPPICPRKQKNNPKALNGGKHTA